jgi:hypothetical protein
MWQGPSERSPLPLTPALSFANAAGCYPTPSRQVTEFCYQLPPLKRTGCISFKKTLPMLHCPNTQLTVTSQHLSIILPHPPHPHLKHTFVAYTILSLIPCVRINACFQAVTAAAREHTPDTAAVPNTSPTALVSLDASLPSHPAGIVVSASTEQARPGGSGFRGLLQRMCRPHRSSSSSNRAVQPQREAAPQHLDRKLSIEHT